MQLHIPLNCSPYHRPIYQSSYPPLSDCHAEKRSYPYFRVPPDETRMKYPLFTGPRTEFTNVGLRRVYPFRATPPSPPSPSSVMNFPHPHPLDGRTNEITQTGWEGNTRRNQRVARYFRIDTTRVVINNRTIARNYRVDRCVNELSRGLPAEEDQFIHLGHHPDHVLVNRENGIESTNIEKRNIKSCRSNIFLESKIFPRTYKIEHVYINTIQSTFEEYPRISPPPFVYYGIFDGEK